MLIYFLARFGLSWREIKAYRLIQFHVYISNKTQFGSTRISIDHRIGKITSIPSSQQVIVTPIEDINVSLISSHIDASSPIVFLVPLESINTEPIEYFLLNKAHNSAIYFTNEITEIPKEYSFLKTTKLKTNSIKQNTFLQNIIGIMNLSNQNIKQKVILITAPFDTFSAAPTFPIGANNGLVISSFLEVMHIFSNFPLESHYAFVFALTNGRFCGNEGIFHLLEKQNHLKFDIAISFESLSASVLHGHIDKSAEDNILLDNFLKYLKESLKKVHIPLEVSKQSDSTQFTQQIFNNFKIPSISISGGPIPSSLTDNRPDFNRSNDFAWAFSEAMLHTIYNISNFYELVDKSFVDTSFWAKSIGNTPRVAPFMERSLVSVFEDWMKKYSNTYIDEWKSTNCFAPYSSTDCTLAFYNPVPIQICLIYLALAFLYGFLVFAVIVGFHSAKIIFRNYFLSSLC